MRWQMVVVFVVALVESVLRLQEVVYAPMYALFMVGPAALIIETLVEQRVPRRLPDGVGNP
jgi:hypothetical protein